MILIRARAARWCAFAGILFPAALVTAAAPRSAHHVVPTLEAEVVRVRPGQTISLALEMRPKPGWHGYWLNPGDAGFALRAAWQLSPGARISALRYPAPTRLVVGGLVSHVFTGSYAILAELTVPSNARAGDRLPIAVDLTWLACTVSICAPEREHLAISVIVGDGAADPARRARFAAFRAALPRVVAEPASYTIADSRVRISLSLPPRSGGGDAHFYPAGSGVIDLGAPQTVKRAGNCLTLDVRTGPTQATGPINGVFTFGSNQALEVTAVPTSRAAAKSLPAIAGQCTKQSARG